jgi:enoyl-CoA hydratase/carnithine racemase
MGTQAPDILIEESETYARIIFNRPHVRNAITSQMWAALPKLLRRLQRQPSVRAVVLSGAGGKAFASGADISELPRFTDPKIARAFETLVVRALDGLVRCRLPVIAMIQATPWAGVPRGRRLRPPHRGRIGPAGHPGREAGAAVNPGVAARLVSLVGPAVAKEILFTGQPLDARRR